MSELVKNAIEHGRSPESDFVGLLIELDERRVRVTVNQTGPTFQPDGERSIVGATGGFGLPIVSATADRWDVERNPFVWFELDISV